MTALSCRFLLNVEILGEPCDPQDLHYPFVDVPDRKPVFISEQIVSVEDRSQRGGTDVLYVCHIQDQAVVRVAQLGDLSFKRLDGDMVDLALGRDDLLAVFFINLNCRGYSPLYLILSADC